MIPWTNLLLFLATLATTTMSGAINLHADGSIFPLQDGLSFSLPLMAILLSHEMGHYIAARIHRVPASLPYFVPLPPMIGLFGTMGAVILQSRTSDRKKLIDIGAAGPLAGLVVAIPVLWYGLSQSLITPVGGGIQEGNSILYAIIKRLVLGEWLPSATQDVSLHPMAFAGWAGLLITMLNLIPIGQLDGGHVAIAFFGNRYGHVSRWMRKLLLPLAVFITMLVYRRATIDLMRSGLIVSISPWDIAIPAGMSWLVWYVMLGLMKRMAGGIDHPPVDDRPLPASRGVLFATVFIAFIITFMPIPIRQSVPAPSLSTADYVERAP